MVEGKTKSHQLRVYFDNTFTPNHIPSFKLVVYDSDGKKIVSERAMPDFTDTHQMIRPELCYKIADKSNQHPNQIKICAQESYSENGKNKSIKIKQ
jgi:hypothetical protein